MATPERAATLIVAPPSVALMLHPPLATLRQPLTDGTTRPLAWRLEQLERLVHKELLDKEVLIHTLVLQIQHQIIQHRKMHSTHI